MPIKLKLKHTDDLIAREGGQPTYDYEARERVQPTYDHGEYMPFSQQLAKLSQGAYTSANADDYTSGTQYMKHPNANYSDDNITTYVHRSNPKEIVIAHRGTDFNASDRGSDVYADLAFAAGRGGVNSKFRDRRKRTEEIIRDSGASSVHLAGHSLGGGTVNHTIANSEYVRDKLTSAHTYNPAANPFMSNSLGVNDTTKAQLQDKVFHHRIDGDPVSEGLTANTPFGTVKTRKNKKKTWFNTVLSATNPFLGAAQTTADTHGIDNFYHN